MSASDQITAGVIDGGSIRGQVLSALAICKWAASYETGIGCSALAVFLDLCYL
jgi:hypothetical protein